MDSNFLVVFGGLCDLGITGPRDTEPRRHMAEMAGLYKKLGEGRPMRTVCRVRRARMPAWTL